MLNLLRTSKETRKNDYRAKQYYSNSCIKQYISEKNNLSLFWLIHEHEIKKIIIIVVL